MEEEEVGQIASENADEGINFNAMMRRMARESIAGAGPSMSIDVETLQATASALAQKAMAILSDESAKGRPVGGVNDIAAAIARRLYRSMAEDSIDIPTPEKLTQRPPETLTSDSVQPYEDRGIPFGEERQKIMARFSQAGLSPSAAAVIADRGLTDRDELSFLFGQFEQESTFGTKMFEGMKSANSPKKHSDAMIAKYRSDKNGVRNTNGQYSAPGIGWIQITGVKEWEMTADHLKRKGMLPSDFDSSMVAKLGTPERDKFISIVSDPRNPASMEAAVAYWEGSTWGRNNGPQAKYYESRRDPNNTFSSRNKAVISRVNPGLLANRTEAHEADIARRRNYAVKWDEKLQRFGFE